MKALILSVVTFASLALLPTTAHASGFLCEGEGYTVKLFNQTDATRTPAVLVVSKSDEQPSTLLRRAGTEIHKSNRANTVSYSVEGSRKLNADKAILQISFKEGRETLAAGESVPAQLILVQDDNRDVVQLSCERYLKN